MTEGGGPTTTAVRASQGWTSPSTACPLPHWPCFVLAVRPPLESRPRGPPAQPPPLPRGLIPSYLNPLETESPQMPGAGPRPLLPPSTDVEGKPGAGAGAPGPVPPREAGPQQETASSGGRELSPRETLAKRPPSHQAQAAILQDAAGVARGQGLPRAAGSRAFRRSPARLVADRSACTLDPGSHFNKCRLQSLRSPPPLLPGWREENSRPDVRPAAWRFWKARPASKSVLPARSLSPHSWAGSGKLWTRVRKAAASPTGAGGTPWGSGWGAPVPRDALQKPPGSGVALAPQTPAPRVCAR